MRRGMTKRRMSENKCTKNNDEDMIMKDVNSENEIPVFERWFADDGGNDVTSMDDRFEDRKKEVREYFESIMTTTETNACNDYEVAQKIQSESRLWQEWLVLQNEYLIPNLVQKDDVRMTNRALKCLHAVLLALRSWTPLQFIINDHTNVNSGSSNKQSLTDLALFHCGYTNDEDDDDVISDVRDAAITVLANLISMPGNYFHITNDGSNKAVSKYKRQVLLNEKCEIAMKGVRARCDDASSDDNDDDDSEDEFSVFEKLRQLSRAKRSLCFDALQSPISHYTHTTSHLNDNGNGVISNSDSKITPSATFVTFLLHSLQGETDPRCLLQMLKLIYNHILVPFPFVLEINPPDEPETNLAVQIFDSIAPYYPINFTPPPNDPFKITPQIIHEALMNILCFNHTTDNSGQEVKKPNNNMTTLALHLFLDRFNPSTNNQQDPYGPNHYEDDEDQPTVQDQLEALQDLQTLLTLSTDNDNNVALDNDDEDDVYDNKKSVYSCLDEQCIKDLASAFVAVHQQATTRLVENKSDIENQLFKNLSHQCRQVAAMFTYRLEQLKSKFTWWDLFLHQCTLSNHKFTSSLFNNPQSVIGRASTAYLAALSACGGIETCGICIDTILPTWLRTLKSFNNNEIEQDDGKVTALWYGVAALVSSTRVTLQQQQRRYQQQFAPNFLEKYIFLIITNITSQLSTLQLQENDNSKSREDSSVTSPSLSHISCIKTLESLFISSSTQTLLNLDNYDKEDKKESIDSFYSLLRQIVSEITIEPGNNTAQKENTLDSQQQQQLSDKWKEACAHMIGTLIAKFMSVSSSSTSFESTNLSQAGPIRNIETLKQLVQNNICLKVWESAVGNTPNFDNTSTKKDKKRYDWLAIAYACEAGKSSDISKIFVSKILQKLLLCIRQQQKEFIQRSETTSNLLTDVPAMLLSYVLQNGGLYPIDVFHSLRNENNRCLASSMDIVDALYLPPEDELNTGVENLMLPNARQECQNQAFYQLKMAYSVIPHFKMAYEKSSTPIDDCKYIIERISNVLPPLSEWDENRLGVLLPILSIILENNGNQEVLKNECSGSLTQLLPHLTEYYLHLSSSKEKDYVSKKSCTHCIYNILATYSIEEGTHCQFQVLFQEILSPMLIERVKQMTTNPDILALEHLSMFQDITNLISTVGQAAAIRGSKKISDIVGRLLIDLSCKGHASSLDDINIEEESLMIRSSMLLSDCSHVNVDLISLTVASSFGSFLGGIHNSSGDVYNAHSNPFWKQRLTHILFPSIVSSCEDCRSQTPCFSRLGPFIVATQIACCVPMLALGNSHIQSLFPIILESIRTCNELITAIDDRTIADEIAMAYHSKLSSARNLAMGALIKFLSHSFDSIKGYGDEIMKTLLMVCGSACKDLNEIVCHLQVLQCMSMFAVEQDSSLSKVKKNWQNFVVRYVRNASLDHPSFHVRRAAVKVLNQWSIIF